MELQHKPNLNKGLHCLEDNNLPSKQDLFLEDKLNPNKDLHCLEANNPSKDHYLVGNNQLNKQAHYLDNHNKLKDLYSEVNNLLKREVSLVVKPLNNLSKALCSEPLNPLKQEDHCLANNSQLSLHYLANLNNKQVLYLVPPSLNNKDLYSVVNNQLKLVDLYLEAKLQVDYLEVPLNKVLQEDHCLEDNKVVHYSGQQEHNKVNPKLEDFSEVPQLLDSASNLKEIFLVVKIYKQLLTPII